jgi:hypothetical protein
MGRAGELEVPPRDAVQGTPVGAERRPTPCAGVTEECAGRNVDHTSLIPHPACNYV